MPVSDDDRALLSGMRGTRAVRALLSGHPVLSFLYHPVVPYMASVAVWAAASWILYFATGNRRFRPELDDRIAYAAAGIVILNFIIKNGLLVFAGIDVIGGCRGCENREKTWSGYRKWYLRRVFFAYKRRLVAARDGQAAARKSVRHSFDAEMPGFACLLSQFEHRSNTDEPQISGRVITEIEINSKKNARSSDCMYFKSTETGSVRLLEKNTWRC